MANLLSAAQVREHIHTALTDDALTRLIKSGDTYIARNAGPHSASMDVVVEGCRGVVTLPRPAASVTTASEWYDDPAKAVVVKGHMLLDGGRGLARSPYAASRAGSGYGYGRSYSFGGGSYDDDTWASWVTVVYTAEDDTALREDVLLQLIRLDLADTGALFTSDGGYIQSSFSDRQKERRRIIEPLIPRYGGAGLLA